MIPLDRRHRGAFSFSVGAVGGKELTYISRGDTLGDMKRPKTIRTSLDIPVQLHQGIHEAARQRGCSARQLILRYMERCLAEEAPREANCVRLPLVPAAGRGVIGDVTNDEALFG